MVMYLASAICDWNRCKAPEKKKSWCNIGSKGKEKCLERLKYGRKWEKWEERIVEAGIDRCIDSEKMSQTEKIEGRDRETER